MARRTVTGTYDGEDDYDFQVWYFDTDAARVRVDNNVVWDGSNNVSRVAGQFAEETLFVTAKGRYAVWRTSSMVDVQDVALELSVDRAVDWLLRNETNPHLLDDVPEELLEKYDAREG